MMDGAVEWRSPNRFAPPPPAEVTGPQGDARSGWFLIPFFLAGILSWIWVVSVALGWLAGR
ncbi:hypothetical protein SAMN04488567_1614 [Limimaricola pyoseonensis]|uniref:Uncharacterized protein n=1 Tax=Limimaricola pyoseonensis TaxID=521013 RepID=A0A1G7CT64_9RHOB|nr:hypothetical protein SAMN04488567_1614 [Limimaricola pyoseonensis]